MIIGLVVGLGITAVLMILGSEYNHRRKMELMRWHAEDIQKLNEELFGGKPK